MYSLKHHYYILFFVAAEEEEWEALALGILHYVQQGGQGTTTVCITVMVKMSENYCNTYIIT